MTTLSQFTGSAPPPKRVPSSAEVKAGKVKLEEVTKILDTLRENATTRKLDTKVVIGHLEQLKVFGRQAEYADPIFTKEGIELLCRYSFESKDKEIAHAALRCLANALFLVAKTRQIFVDLDFVEKAAQRLKINDKEDEFLISRILFLTTYGTNVNFENLIDQQQLAESINQNISRHAKQYSKGRGKNIASLQDDMALSETLKLIFNITHFYPDRCDVFSKSIPDILKILYRRKVPRPALQGPINYLINALINLDLENKKTKTFAVNPLFPKMEPKCNAEHMINILDHAVTDYPEVEVDQLAAPLVALIRKVFEIAPDGVKRYMQWLILPSDEERSKPIGRSNTLSSRLLNLSTSPMAPTLRESVSSLFFELSGKDASNFVQNVGYGFASGFLLSHNVPIPETALEAFSTGEKQGANGKKKTVNPITGQHTENEEKIEEIIMTDEEKEREAERLFVLFERLKKTGIVDVQNPVQKAVDEGRFEEIE